MSSPDAPNTPEAPDAPLHDRWHFIRDMLVFQLKLVLGNVLNFVMLPVSLVAGVYDLVIQPKARHGENFYKVLEWSREADEAINIYGAIGGYHRTGASPAAVCVEASAPPDDAAASGGRWRGTTVDGVVRSVEDVIVREIRKGGTAASVKTAVDKLLDEIQRDSNKKR